MHAAARAEPVPLDLPCIGADGESVPETAIKVIDVEFRGEVRQAPAVAGHCQLLLEPCTYWVKAESPGRRSVALRIRWPSALQGRELRLIPLRGRDAYRQRALQSMVQADQAVREALAVAEHEGDKVRVERLRRAMEVVDGAHVDQMRRWLSVGGFPRAADVGYDGVRDAWLLIQHASAVLPGQLPALRRAAQAGELGRDSLALSEDRVRMQAGQPQRYGSQLEIDKDGEPILYRLESLEQVDAWRETIYLEPLGAYLKRFSR